MSKLLYAIAVALLTPAQASAGSPCPDTHLVELRVKQIIAELAALGSSDLDRSSKVAEQQRLFGELEDLGPSAVPAIIAQMDDRRPLAVAQISLQNRSPNAFEAVRHYGPEQIVDALDAILNQITGESFGFIVNGGTETERSNSVAGWRTYAAKLHCRDPEAH